MEIKGICPIAPAVYNDRGEVDIADYMSCSEKLIGLGAQALTLFGIAGEYYKMDTEEERELIGATVKVCHAEYETFHRFRDPPRKGDRGFGGGLHDGAAAVLPETRRCDAV